MVQNVDEDKSFKGRVESGDTDAVHDGGYEKDLPKSKMYHDNAGSKSDYEMQKALRYRTTRMKPAPKSAPKGGGK